MNGGKLFVVPTPIGNLEDITLRALRVLKEVDIIVAEDTRQTRKLLHHYGIEKQLLSHHSFNEHKTVDNIIRLLEGGQQVALVSDSGTPSISDPGFLLVRHCIEAGLTVECLPGPTAFVPALVVSGLPIHEFVFIGFLPHKKGRGSAIKRLAEEQRTVILYESPHRMLKLLEQLLSFAGPERKISVSRELTKKFEQTVRGSIEDVLKHFRHNEPRGEFVVVMEGKRNV